MVQYRDRLYLDPDHPPDVEEIDGQEVTFEMTRLCQMSDTVEYLFRALPSSIREGHSGYVLYRCISLLPWRFETMEDMYEQLRGSYEEFKIAYKRGEFPYRFDKTEEFEMVPRNKTVYAFFPAREVV